MHVGRLAWRTPTGAMLWEIWGRHKLSFLWQGAALAASVFFAQWKEHGASKDVAPLLIMASCICFLGAYLYLLTSFAYIEVDARRVQLGFPGRLLLKPLSTARLVLAPMLFGGLVIVTVFAIWTELVLRHFGSVATSDLLLISAVLLSFFWWMQALAWSLPLLKGRVLVLLVVGLIHLLVAIPPQMPVRISSGCQWRILAALLVSAVPAAWIGLKGMREGRWEGPSRISVLWGRLGSARAQGARKSFGSAFGAQFWLEWRRQGLLLPGISGGMALLMVPGILTGLKWLGAGAGPQDEIQRMMLILPLLVLPLVLSLLMGSALARFDPLHSMGELPLYIAVRPMTNGGFVTAKLAMALATSVLTWLVMTAAFLCVALMGKETLLSKAGLVTPYGPVAFITGCVPGLLLLVIWTWRNLVAGMGAGLTGRTWIIVAFIFSRVLLLDALILLVATAASNVNFRQALLHWLTGILTVCLAAKLAVSIAAFAWGLRRNAITARAVGWIAGGWSVCGLLVAGYAGRVCNSIRQPDLWIWVALGGLLILPLADLAIAPLALAWNRHR